MVEIDQYGRIKNRHYRGPAGQNGQDGSLPQFSGWRHTRSARPGFWARYDDFISDIGHLFEDNGDAVSFYLTAALFATIAIGFVVHVVRTWNAGHPFAAIATAWIVGAVAFHGFWVIVGIPFLCFELLFFACRLLFRNAAWFTTITVLALVVHYVATHEAVLMAIQIWLSGLGRNLGW